MDISDSESEITSPLGGGVSLRFGEERASDWPSTLARAVPPGMIILLKRDFARDIVSDDVDARLSGESGDGNVDISSRRCDTIPEGDGVSRAASAYKFSTS